jgi:hypothetical protein
VGGSRSALLIMIPLQGTWRRAPQTHAPAARSDARKGCKSSTRSSTKTVRRPLPWRSPNHLPRPSSHSRKAHRAIFSPRGPRSHRREWLLYPFLRTSRRATWRLSAFSHLSSSAIFDSHSRTWRHHTHSSTWHRRTRMRSRSGICHTIRHSTRHSTHSRCGSGRFHSSHSPSHQGRRPRCHRHRRPWRTTTKKSNIPREVCRGRACRRPARIIACHLSRRSASIGRRATTMLRPDGVCTVHHRTRSSVSLSSSKHLVDTSTTLPLQRPFRVITMLPSSPCCLGA